DDGRTTRKVFHRFNSIAMRRRFRASAMRWSRVGRGSLSIAAISALARAVSTRASRTRSTFLMASLGADWLLATDPSTRQSGFIGRLHNENSNNLTELKSIPNFRLGSLENDQD